MKNLKFNQQNLKSLQTNETHGLVVLLTDLEELFCDILSSVMTYIFGTPDIPYLLSMECIDIMTQQWKVYTQESLSRP